MDSRARFALRTGDTLFDRKKPVDSLRQEIALNFYPERASFTDNRTEGEEFADHLFSSYPVLAHREFSNMLGEFLRPEKFFAIHVDDEELDAADEERAYLEKLSEIQWRVMSDPVALLTKAATATDADIAAFGDGVLHFGLNPAGDAMLFRNYHLRDCAWAENAETKVDLLHRNWEPTARQLEHLFPKTISEQVKKACGTGAGGDPDKVFPCRHVVLPARLYDYSSKGGKKYPFVSLFIERETQTVLEEVGLTQFSYVVPRWRTVSGSVYATSMITAILLPDSRTLQVVMRTLREAGEMHVNPAMVAVDDVVRGDVALYPGGITIVDREYDERLGEALRPITRDKGGFPIGEAIAEALKQDIRSGAFLDKIQLPETTRPMTATEVRRRIQEFIRGSAPIAKPIQQEYNHPLCDGVFQILREQGVFPIEEMPASLADREVKFKFRSPLDELAEQNEAEVYLDVRDRFLVPAAQGDPSLWEIADMHTATRDAMRAAGWKAKWFKPKEAVDERREEQEQEEQAAKMAQEIATAGQVAEQGGRGLDALVGAAQRAQQPANGAAMPAERRRAGR